jgi:hypothetical protein
MPNAATKVAALRSVPSEGADMRERSLRVPFVPGTERRIY